MRAWFYLLLTIFLCISLLVIDIWPGVFGAIFIDSILGSFVCGCWIPMTLLLYVIHLITRDPSPIEVPQRNRYRFTIARWVIVSITFLLWFWDIPRRVVFSFYRHEFEALIENAPRGEDLGELNQQIGPYFVDRYGIDPESGDGVYFGTLTYHRGLGYGFVYRPNRQRPPFLWSECTYGHLFGDWYWFRGWDDF